MLDIVETEEVAGVIAFLCFDYGRLVPRM